MLKKKRKKKEKRKFYFALLKRDDFKYSTGELTLLRALAVLCLLKVERLDL